MLLACLVVYELGFGLDNGEPVRSVAGSLALSWKLVKLSVWLVYQLGFGGLDVGDVVGVVGGQAFNNGRCAWFHSWRALRWIMSMML